MHAGDMHLQARDEVLSTDWLFSCKEELIWPPKASHWIKVSPSVSHTYKKQIDSFGDPQDASSADADQDDLRAVVEKVVKRRKTTSEFQNLKHVDAGDQAKLCKIIYYASQKKGRIKKTPKPAKRKKKQ